MDMLKDAMEINSKLTSGENVFEIAPRKKLIMKKISETMCEEVTWLWDKNIPNKKLTIFAGKGGKGKSQMLAYIASEITNGGYIPLSNKKFKQGKVLILSAEDEVSDAIRPRIVACGGNIDMIYELNASPIVNDYGKKIPGVIRLDEDLSLIDDKLQEDPDIRLLIIDPITSYLGGVDHGKSGDLRPILSYLSHIAHERNIAVIANTHFNKKNDVGTPLDRIIGSESFVNAARSVIVFGEHPDDADEKNKRIVMKNAKNNYAPLQDGYIYRIKHLQITQDVLKADMSIEKDATVPISRIEFMDERFEEDDYKLLPQVGEKKHTKIDDAIAFLESKLSKGPALVSDLRSQWQAASGNPEKKNSIGTLYVAARRLGIEQDQTVREGKERQYTMWTLDKK